MQDGMEKKGRSAEYITEQLPPYLATVGAMFTVYTTIFSHLLL